MKYVVSYGIWFMYVGQYVLDDYQCSLSQEIQSARCAKELGSV